MTRQEEIFNSLSDEEKFEALIDAIEHMGQYNGRSTYECINHALGVPDNREVK